MRKRIFILLALMLLLVGLFAVPVCAETVVQDGIEVTLTTDKESYESLDMIDAKLTVRNRNSFDVDNVSMEIKAPRGYKLMDGGRMRHNRLAAGETQHQQTNMLDTEADVPALPKTGDDSHGMLWGLLFVLSFAVMCVLLYQNHCARKMLSLFLCVTILSTLIPPCVHVKAETNGKSITVSSDVTVDGKPITIFGLVTYDTDDTFSSSFNYSISNDQVTITGYTGSDAVVAIPEMIDGYPVTTIGNSAFIKTRIKSIKIPEGVTRIEKSAFSDCDYLSEVDLPSSLVFIGAGAFVSCDELEEISLPDSVTSLGESAFSGCSSLKEINYPKNLETVPISNALGVSPFGSCPNLTKMIIPEGVTKIPASIFESCNSISEIILPSTLTTIGAYAFHDTGITNITIPDGVTRIEAYTFGYCKNLTTINLPKRLEYIGRRAFEQCTQLKSIELPDSIICLTGEAFDGNSVLKVVNYPENWKNVGTEEWTPFSDCPELTKIVIPEGVTKIPDYAFCACESLTKIYIPSSVTSISESVFFVHSDDLVIYGVKGSYAETYANQNDIPFVAGMFPDDEPSSGDMPCYHINTIESVIKTEYLSVSDEEHQVTEHIQLYCTDCYTAYDVEKNQYNEVHDFDEVGYCSVCEFTNEVKEITLSISSAIEGQALMVRWNEIEDIDHYQYNIRDLTTDTPIWGETGESTTNNALTLHGIFVEEGHEYKIWVAAFDAEGTLVCQTTQTVTASAAQTNSLILTHETPLAGVDLDVSWTDLEDAEHYEYSLRDLTTNELHINREETKKAYLTISGDLLEAEHGYKLWVGAIGEDGAEPDGDHQATVTFTVTQCQHGSPTKQNEVATRTSISDAQHHVVSTYDLYCTYCDTTIETGKNEEYDEDHSFDENGDCTLCDYIAGCKHEVTERVETAVNYLKYDEQQHKYVVNYQTVCADETCGKVIVELESETTYEDHQFEGNTCKLCGYTKNAELSASVTREAASAVVGELIAATASVNGGSGSYSYSWQILCDGELVHEEAFEYRASYTPDKAGNWVFTVTVTDNSTKEMVIASSVPIVVADVECLHETTTETVLDTKYIKTSDTMHEKQEVIKITCDGCGAVISSGYEKNAFENHIYMDGKCVCGVSNPDFCKHEGDIRIEEVDKRIEEYDENEHIVIVVYRDICEECLSVLYVMREYSVHAEHVYENGTCVCGRIEEVCDHTPIWKLLDTEWIQVDDEYHEVIETYNIYCACGMIDTQEENTYTENHLLVSSDLENEHPHREYRDCRCGYSEIVEYKFQTCDICYPQIDYSEDETTEVHVKYEGKKDVIEEGVISKKEAKNFLNDIFGLGAVGQFWGWYFPDEKVEDFFALLTGDTDDINEEELNTLRKRFVIAVQIRLMIYDKESSEQLKMKMVERLMSYGYDEANIDGAKKSIFEDVIGEYADFPDIAGELMDTEKVVAILDTISLGFMEYSEGLAQQILAELEVLHGEYGFENIGNLPYMPPGLLESIPHQEASEIGNLTLARKYAKIIFEIEQMIK